MSADIELPTCEICGEDIVCEVKCPVCGRVVCEDCATECRKCNALVCENCHELAVCLNCHLECEDCIGECTTCES